MSILQQATSRFLHLVSNLRAPASAGTHSRPAKGSRAVPGAVPSDVDVALRCMVGCLRSSEGPRACFTPSMLLPLLTTLALLPLTFITSALVIGDVSCTSYGLALHEYLCDTDRG